MKSLSVRTSVSGWFLIGTAALAAFFLYLKILDYEQLNYRCDVFSMLESTRSWLKGETLLREARYGDPTKMHNFYILLLFAPVTLLLGAKGLFYVHAIVLWLVSWAVLRFFSKRGKREETLWTVGILYWGPYGFWIFMNPAMGWHIETFFLPFGLLFALALCSASTLNTILSGLLLAITREDGPILACCLHLMWFYLTRFEPSYGKPLSVIARLLPAWKILALWGVLFVMEMALLAYRNGDEPVRSTRVLLHLQGIHAFELLKFGIATLGAGMVVWSPVLIGTGLIFGWRRAAVMMLLGAPLALVMYWAGFIYYPNKEFSLSWNPRMALVWGFSVGSFLLMIYTESRSLLLRPKMRLITTLVVVLAIQLLALARHRRFYPIQVASDLIQNALRPEPSYVQTLRCLSEEIPRSAYVALEYAYFAPFEWHNYIWLETKYLKNAPVAQPDVIIAATPELKLPVYDTLSWHMIDSTRYQRRRVGDIFVLTRPGYDLDLRECEP